MLIIVGVALVRHTAIVDIRDFPLDVVAYRRNTTVPLIARLTSLSLKCLTHKAQDRYAVLRHLIAIIRVLVLGAYFDVDSDLQTRIRL